MEHALTVLYPTPAHQRLAFGYEVMMDAQQPEQSQPLVINDHDILHIYHAFTSIMLGCRWAGLLFSSAFSTTFFLVTIFCIWYFLHTTRMPTERR